MNIDPGTAVWTLMIGGTGLVLLLLLPDVISATVNTMRRFAAFRAHRESYTRSIRPYR